MWWLEVWKKPFEGLKKNKWTKYWVKRGGK